MNRLNILDGLHRYRLDRHISSLLMAIAIGILSGYGAINQSLVNEMSGLFLFTLIFVKIGATLGIFPLQTG